MPSQTYGGNQTYNSCTCQVAGSFSSLSGKGIISVNVRANNNFSLTDCDIVMYGPTMGDVSLSAYAPLIGGEKNSLRCPGRAGTSVEWMQKIACSTGFSVFMLPSGRNKAYMEGGVTNKIQMKVLGNCSAYDVVNASASSGPATPSLVLSHRDGYEMSYSGGPISVNAASANGPMSVGFLSGVSGLLPKGAGLYLTSFSWEYNPPNIPVVNYSFIFTYTGCTTAAVNKQGSYNPSVGDSNSSILGSQQATANWTSAYSAGVSSYSSYATSSIQSFNSPYSSKTGSNRQTFNYNEDRNTVY